MLNKLIAIRLRSLLLGFTGRSKSGKQSRAGVAYIAILGVLVLAFAGMSAMFAVLFAKTLIAAGLDAIYFALFNIIAFTVVFVFSIFETKSELFDCKDNELLLSMPIPTGKIVLSRVIGVLLLNIAECGIIMIPAVVVYLIYGGGALIAVGAILTMLLIALLATALAAGVGYGVAQISSFFKNKGVVAVIASVAFLAVYFVGYSALMSWLDSFGESPSADVLLSTFGGIAFLGEISIMDKPAFWIFAAVSIAVSLIAYWVISVTYIGVITRTAKGKNAVYRERHLKRSSQLLALSRKELAGFFSCPTYILNGAIGSVMTVIVSVYLLVGGREMLPMLRELFMTLGFADYNGTLYMMFCGALIFMGALNITSASSVSLEGNNFWVLKTAPVSSISQLYAKLVPHLVIAVPSSLVSSLLAAIALEADLLGWLILFALPIICNLLFALFGLVINVLMPKFDYVNEAQVVKQSGAVFFAMLGSMLFSLLVLAGGVGLVYLLGGAWSFIILTAVLIILVAVMLILLVGPVRRRFERL